MWKIPGFKEDEIFSIFLGVFCIFQGLIIINLISDVKELQKENIQQEMRLQDCYYAFLANPHSWEAFSTPYMKKKWTADPPKHHNYIGTPYEWKPDTEEVFSVRFPDGSSTGEVFSLEWDKDGKMKLKKER